MKVTYILFKGFLKIGEFSSILEAKSNTLKEDGVYNLLSSDKTYRDSWQIVNGNFYNEGV